MGWGAELGIGARKRTLQSWFIARWKYHASVGVSAKRFQEKRVIRAGRNAAVEWRLVADQRPVRDAIRRLIVAKQRKRETNFCRDVWGEWRHQVWLSFRVYLGKISARASVVKFSFGAWYTLWCRQVYGPRCMRNAVERLSLYRVLGVWMDEVEEECAWKEEELAKRMLAEVSATRHAHRFLVKVSIAFGIFVETWSIQHQGKKLGCSTRDVICMHLNIKSV